MSELPVIPLCVPCLSGREKGYVDEALDTNWVSYVGPHVQKFEEQLVAASGAPFAVAMNSGTSALHIALIQAGVGHENEVVMPAVTFVSPANAVRYCGAWPVFVDIRSDDWQMSVDETRTFLADGCHSTPGGLVNKHTGRIVKAIMLVHLLGGMGDVDAFAKVAGEFGLFLIEDGAECLGATYKQRSMAAANEYMDPKRRLLATSFNGNKIVTTGGGGALFTHDEATARRAKHLSTTAKSDPVEFYHDELGYNYRLTNVSAALGVGQMESLDDHVNRKRAVAAAYEAALNGVPGIVKTHPEPEHCRSTFWMYTVQLDRPARPVVDQLGKSGIISRPLWRPMFELPAMKGSAIWGQLPVTRVCCARSISLPCSVSLTNIDQDRVIQSLRQIPV
ncbi:MAG: aminotransferase class I/II-fold pyridoxal phosphate-dependent enzyme [Verrucomicrobiota bacterium]